mgnify:CR=1 FL=1
MKALTLSFAILIVSNVANATCKTYYKQKIRSNNVNAAASTTAIPLLSSTAAAAGYYGPLTSTTTTTGTLGAVPVSTSSSTISNAQAEIYAKANDLINQSKIGFGKHITVISDEIRLTLNDFTIDEMTIAKIIKDGDQKLIFCQSIDELFTYPGIRNYVINKLK